MDFLQANLLSLVIFLPLVGAIAIAFVPREEGGQHFVDLQLATVNQNGEEVLSGYASARIDP